MDKDALWHVSERLLRDCLIVFPSDTDPAGRADFMVIDDDLGEYTVWVYCGQGCLLRWATSGRNDMFVNWVRGDISLAIPEGRHLLTLVKE